MKKFIAKIFGKGEEAPVKTYDDFWKWFAKNHKAFRKIVMEGEHIEEAFFSKIGPKLDSIKSGYWFMCGRFDEDTVELIITADSFVKNIVFAEELIAAAPQLPGWRFTALKPEHEVQNCRISMDDLAFNHDVLSFYPVEDPQCPDEINIVVIHQEYTADNADDIIRGSYIFLEHYLGELNSVTAIDSLDFKGPADAAETPIPIERLKSYLVWREKEFVEKYEGHYPDDYEDGISVLQADLEDGSIAIATVNTSLLEWEGKVAYPWMLRITINYDPQGDMPDEATNDRLNTFEDRLIEKLKGDCLWLAHETNRGIRDIYFACKEFRKVSKIVWQEEQDFPYNYEFTYDIFKDKYWRTLEHFV